MYESGVYHYNLHIMIEINYAYGRQLRKDLANNGTLKQFESESILQISLYSFKGVFLMIAFLYGISIIIFIFESMTEINLMRFRSKKFENNDYPNITEIYRSVRRTTQQLSIDFKQSHLIVNIIHNYK